MFRNKNVFTRKNRNKIIKTTSHNLKRIYEHIFLIKGEKHQNLQVYSSTIKNNYIMINPTTLVFIWIKHLCSDRLTLICRYIKYKIHTRKYFRKSSTWVMDNGRLFSLNLLLISSPEIKKLLSCRKLFSFLLLDHSTLQYGQKFLFLTLAS